MSNVKPEITLRDQIAIRVLPAVFTQFERDREMERIEPFTERDIARYAYKLADAMLAARSDA